MTNYTPEVQDLLDSADQAFDAGNVRDGSRLVWEAVRTGITAVAKKNGWPCSNLDEIKDVVYRLDGVDEDGNFTGSYPRYFAHFGVADRFREHAETVDWEYPEFQWSEVGFRMGRKSVREFLTLLGRYADTENSSQ